MTGVKSAKPLIFSLPHLVPSLSLFPRCPRYPSIFPELQLEERTKSLFGDFKAFRFPSTARVNFVATIRFCQDRCEPVRYPSQCQLYDRSKTYQATGGARYFPNRTVPVSFHSQPSEVSK